MSEERLKEMREQEKQKVREEVKAGREEMLGLAMLSMLSEGSRK